MADTIFVQSTRDDNRVVLSERHPLHPGGEVFIAGPTRNKLQDRKAVLDKDGNPVQEDNIVEVGQTPLVMLRLSQNLLKEVKGKAAKSTVAKTGGND